MKLKHKVLSQTIVGTLLQQVMTKDKLGIILVTTLVYIQDLHCKKKLIFPLHCQLLLLILMLL